MYFEKIYMHGFKSFADPVTIDFNDGITCIVGPNGSGKSNISDAIRWVLGEQSPKMLRGGKMEEIIFSGTASRKSRGMAEVTLVIDNEAGVLPIDYRKVAITRRMYRSGEGEYLINGNHCRLRDIRELIMDTGIGVDGYSLIGQGKISDIVSSKQDVRREIFEEAAGIVKYRTKKQDAEKKLENSIQNLDRVSDIINEIESRIGGLKTDSEKAKEYLEIKDKYDKLEINITLKNIEDTDIKNEYLKDDILTLSGTLEQVKEEKASLISETAKAKEKNLELEDLINRYREKSIEARDKMAMLIKEKELSAEKLESLVRDRTGIESRLETYREKLEHEEKNENELLNKVKNLMSEKETLEKSLQESIEEYEKKNKFANESILSIDSDRNKIFELQSDISSKKSEINGIDNLRNNLILRQEEIDSNTKDSEYDSNSRELESKLGEKAEADKALNEICEYMDKANNLRAFKVKELAEIDEKIRENRVFIEGTRARKKTLEELEQSYEGYSHGVKFIMNRGVNGLYGTVAELISVNRENRTAIETALGYGLQNIVCKDDRSAKSAIKLLKDNKAGRLTFLPVNSMRGSALESRIFKNEKGFVGIASECIEYEEHLRPVMEHLLGKVVIADTLDNAVAMSKGKRTATKFVTLTGEIVNSSGAMTGGNLKSGKGGLLTRKSELLELTSKIKNMEEENKTLIEKKENVQSDILKTDADLDKKILEKNKNEDRLTEINRDVAVLEMKNEELNFSRERTRQELKKLSEQLDESQKMANDLKIKVAEMEDEMQNLISKTETDRIENEKIKEDLREHSETITHGRISLSKATAEYDAANEALGAVRDRIAEYTKELEEGEAEVSHIADTKANLEEKIRGLVININMAELDIKNVNSYDSELEQEKKHIRELLEKLESKVKLLDEDINGFAGRKYELEIKQAKQETTLENLKNKLWEEFEISYVQAVEYRDREIDLKEAQKEAKHLKARLKAIGEVNLGSIKEYESVNKRYEFLVEQRDDLNTAMSGLKDIISRMDRNIKKNFNDSFSSIMKNFDETFKELFGGGTAKLSLEDESRPLDCNIEITAQPPGKKLQNINLMSGGEKTMTAIALMFAVLKAKPTPFCILDEVEAALDDANIERFAKYLKTFKDIQFALVTHQKVTMEHGDSLFGVTMPEQGISKILSLKLGDEIEL